MLERTPAVAKWRLLVPAGRVDLEDDAGRADRLDLYLLSVSCHKAHISHVQPDIALRPAFPKDTT